MKKWIVLLFALLTMPVVAQEFHFIPKVGLNIANMTQLEGDVRPGVNVGFAAEFPVAPSFAIEPGLYYSMQGTKDSEDGLKATLQTDYLNIPIYAKFYAYEGFHLFAGPQFGFNVRSKAKVSSSGTALSTDFKDYINTFDFSLGIGAGYQFDMGLLISANYNIGLTNAIKADALKSDLTADWKKHDLDSHHGVFQITLGWRF